VDPDLLPLISHDKVFEPAIKGCFYVFHGDSLNPGNVIFCQGRELYEYYYLAYRDSNRVKFDYIGPADSDAVIELEAKIKQRTALEEKLQQVKENLNDVERGLRGQR
jgi:hypothetical protein